MTRHLALVILAALWLGAALIVAAVVAPAAFAALPSRALAGALVGRVLPTVFLSGCAAGIISAALAVLDPAKGGAFGRTSAAVVWAVACGVAQFSLTPRIERIRVAAGGPIDSLAANAPLRVAFGRLHGISVGLLGIAMLAAIVVLCSAARAMRR
jgi:Domain of unknown function (DUF4149)